ncbi:uncharacterized protein LOC119658320 [Hermetia illucens]|uniref:uncharacterized protein LOC119658320 n=1 Tax=Hermetia illucens TaxID=343691 RepID=UPI0018CC0C77|nr:uncharacterized protein LOC119658320 [Hermetia illucens]
MLKKFSNFCYKTIFLLICVPDVVIPAADEAKCYELHFANISCFAMIRDYVDCLVTIQDKIYINGDVTLYKDFDNVYLKIEVGTVRNKLHKSVFIKTFAYCNFHPKNNAMMKMVVVSLRNTTNFDFNCPVKKGKYFLRNLKIFSPEFPYKLFYKAKIAYYVCIRTYFKHQGKLIQLTETNTSFAIERSC